MHNKTVKNHGNSELTIKVQNRRNTLHKIDKHKNISWENIQKKMEINNEKYNIKRSNFRPLTIWFMHIKINFVICY